MEEPKYNLNLGYSSICMFLRELDIFPSHGLVVNSVNKEKGLEKAKSIATRNIQDMQKIIIWNETQGIRVYRLTSELFPHLGNPLTPEYDITFALEDLKETGKIAKSFGHRLTMHPGQHNVLNSPNENVVRRTINELVNHANILKAMKYSPQDGSVIVIHVGGIYGDKNSALQRWKDNFKLIPKYCQEYIVIENDEFSYGVNDVINLAEEMKIPMILDFFHNEVSNDKVEITDELLKRIANTWKYGRPKFHYSVQLKDARRGSHGKTIDFLPPIVLFLPKILQRDVDCILEVKDKEISVLKMYKKYFSKIEKQYNDGYNKIYWQLNY